MAKRKLMKSDFFEYIIKENGKQEIYDPEKGRDALIKAMDQNNCLDPSLATKLVKEIEKRLNDDKKGEIPTSKEWADTAYKVLKEKGKKDLAESYIDNRKEKAKNRLRNSPLMASFDDILNSSGDDPNSILNENANISGFDPAAQLHRIASESNKNFVLDYLLPSEYAKAHREKWIHIHDLDYYELNYNCLQFDLIGALNDGFDTGKGLNREPHSIQTAAALTAILLQSSTNQQHGGIAVLNLDFALGKYVNVTFRKEFKKIVEDYYKVVDEDLPFYFNKNFLKQIYYGITEEEIRAIVFKDKRFNSKIMNQIMKFVQIAKEETERDTEQAMQGFCHNMNTLHCLPYSENIWVYDTKNEELMLIEIGKFCDEIFEENRYQVYSLNKTTNKIEKKFVTAVAKQDNNRDVTSIKTDLGTVTVTDNHEVLTNIDGEILDKLPADVTNIVSLGDTITYKVGEDMFEDIPIDLALRHFKKISKN